MKIKSSNALKLLRTFHIITAGVWFGGTVCISVLALICFFSSDQTQFLTLAPIMQALYPYLILPAALLTIRKD
jgi:amino acid transporter